MIADWSDQNKKFQRLISKDETFAEGIKILHELKYTERRRKITEADRVRQITNKLNKRLQKI